MEQYKFCERSSYQNWKIVIRQIQNLINKRIIIGRFTLTRKNNKDIKIGSGKS